MLTHQGPWTLTQGAFDQLLARLGPDRESAGTAYEELRGHLIRFFRAHAPFETEQWADIVLDRVARKNEACEIDNIHPFIWGVARMVRSEMFRASRRHVSMERPAELPEEPRTEEQLDWARKSKWLNRCVQRLPAGDGELLLAWYSNCEEAAQRQQLAVSLGISVVSLRVRAYRARLRLRRMALREGF